MLADHSLEAIFLGILQGATEFLPISSSAHLLLVPWLLGWESMGLTFDVLVHGGTLAAVVIYFHKEWIRLSKQSLRQFLRQSTEQSRLLGALIVGTVPAVLAGWLLESVIASHLRRPAITGITLGGFGLLLWWADGTASQVRQLSHVRMRDGLVVGLAQALALVPGVSRSGVTISAALMLGLSRADSARFSFLLGTPLIAAATLRSLYQLWYMPSAEAGSVTPLVIGVLFSLSSGFLCIRYFLKFLRTRTYRPFVVYRLVLAAFIFALLLWKA